MTCECAREQDVLDAAVTGRWPDRAGAELRAHVAACAVCADVAEIAPLFAEDRDAASQQADLPPANAVWWRAQMRVRREAAAQAARPMVLVQRAALAYAAVGLFGLGVLLGPWIRAWVRATAGLVEWLTPTRDTLTAIVAAAQASTVPLAAAAIVLLLAPVLVYLALQDR